MVTGEQVEKAMFAANITRVDHHECAFCGLSTRYTLIDEKLYYDSSCGCCESESTPQTFDSAATWLNMQESETILRRLMTRFGFNEADIDAAVSAMPKQPVSPGRS